VALGRERQPARAGYPLARSASQAKSPGWIGGRVERVGLGLLWAFLALERAKEGENLSLAKEVR
jgi:hypothetical protein